MLPMVLLSKESFHMVGLKPVGPSPGNLFCGDSRCTATHGPSVAIAFGSWNQ